MLCQECDGHVVKHHNNNVRIWERLKMDSGTTIIVQVDIRACSPGPLFQTSHSSRGNLTFHCSFGRSRRARTECSRCRKAENYKLCASANTQPAFPMNKVFWITPSSCCSHLQFQLISLSVPLFWNKRVFGAGWVRVCMLNFKMLWALLKWYTNP